MEDFCRSVRIKSNKVVLPGPKLSIQEYWRNVVGNSARCWWSSCFVVPERGNVAPNLAILGLVILNGHPVRSQVPEILNPCIFEY